METLNFQDKIPSFPIHNFKDHYVLVSELISMQNATEICHYLELIGEPLRLELNFTFPQEHLTELIVLGERMYSVAVDKFVVVGKKFKMDSVSIQQIFNHIPLLKCRFRGSFHSDYVPTHDNDTFAIVNTQPRNVLGEHWITVENFCHKIYFADSLGRPVLSISSTSSWCQNHYNLNYCLPSSTQYMQLFVSWSSDRKKLLDFTMLLYFQL